jgi:selenocysteine lyase/cysteine desulfurase
LREGLRETRNVRLVSPSDPQLRSGIVCFMVGQMDAEHVVDQLRLAGVHVSVTPYQQVFVRAGCPLFVGERGVDRAIAAIRAL